MKLLTGYKSPMWFMVLLLTVLMTGCGGGGVVTRNGVPAKAMTAFVLAGVPGTINEPAKTIAVTVPFGTNVTALVATFTTTGASVMAGSTVQTSSATPNNFISPVAYIVTATDGTTVTYIVTVTVAPTTAKTMTSFSFAGYTGAAGIINEPAKTIAVIVPYGTNVTALVATFTTTGTIVKVGTSVQTSTATPNNFTNPVAYIVTAADALTATYTVTVTVAAATAKALTSFSFAGYSGAAGTINEPAKTIAVTVPYGTDVMTLVATFATTGTSVIVGSTFQTSTSNPNNFTSPVAYIVTAADASTATYTVTVMLAANTAKVMTAFSFAGYSGATGTINESAKTIAVTVPYGTDITTLVATFTTTGTIAKVGTSVQTSAASSNNFTSPVAYIVTAADASAATYVVTVTVATNTAKVMTAFSFAGYTGAAGTINESAKTITVTVPYGTNLTALVATFTSTGVSVMVGMTVQSSAATANNFSGPVSYIVTAADASTATYIVSVTVATNTAKAMTAFLFAGYTGAAGTINESAKTIAVTVPYGTNLTALVATFTSTGANVVVGAAVQTSAATANDFTSPVAYIVTAADASTATYTVTVTLALNTAKAITAYSFVGYTGAAGTINEASKTIAVTLPFGTIVTNLVATFTSTGGSVKIGPTVQTSSANTNDFTNPVAYIVTAADTSTATYSITVSVAANTAKAITAFSFSGYGGAAGVIDEAGKTIAVTVPFGTNVTALAATFSTTGANVKVGATVQTSNVSLDDFTSPVNYTVTAADASTTTYTVTVAVAANTAKAMTAFSFAGYGGAAGVIDEAAKTIAVTVPFATDVSVLVATFTATGTTVKVGAIDQTSTSTANDFTGPVAYIVTAADATSATYIVTVTVAASSAKALTAFSFASFSHSAGTIDEAAKTVAVTVPPGTNLSSLVATFAGTGVSVRVGASVQTSAASTNDFTGPVAYIVTAADASTATYTVAVTLGAGPAPVVLGLAGNYAIFADTGIYNATAPAAISGNMGMGPGVTSAAITGPWALTLVSSYSTSSQVIGGNVYAHDYAAPTPANVTTASTDMLAAYNDAASRPAGTGLQFLNVGAGSLDAKILSPGTYSWNTAVNLPVGANVTLTGGPNDVWIFQIAGALTTGASSNVILTGGALPGNVIWQVNGAVTMGVSAHFEGVVLAKAEINLGSLASANSRLLAQTAVNIDRSTVTQPPP
jgi:hypothetical protein